MNGLGVLMASGLIPGTPEHDRRKPEQCSPPKTLMIHRGSAMLLDALGKTDRSKHWSIVETMKNNERWGRTDETANGVDPFAAGGMQITLSIRTLGGVPAIVPRCYGRNHMIEEDNLTILEAPETLMRNYMSRHDAGMLKPCDIIESDMFTKTTIAAITRRRSIMTVTLSGAFRDEIPFKDWLSGMRFAS